METTDDFNSKCRTCLSESNSYHRLDDCIADNYNILEMLNGIVPQVAINTASIFSTLICQSCVNKLLIGYKFQQLCIKSNDRLHELLNITFKTKPEHLLIPFMCDANLEVKEELIDISYESGIPSVGLQSDNESIMVPNEDGIYDTSSSTNMGHIKNELSSLTAKLDVVLKRQDEITNLIVENNVLLQRNKDLRATDQTIFPLDSKNDLNKLDYDLVTDKKTDINIAINRILSGGLKHIGKIIGKNIINSYNVDGVKGKKPLKKYNNILNAIYEATQTEGRTYDEFIKELRTCLHRLKNTINRAKSRKWKRSNILNNQESDENLDDSTTYMKRSS